MNLTDCNPYGNGLQYVGFNQNKVCFVTAMADGFRIFNSDPLKQCKKQKFNEGGLAHAEMLLCTNYIALVGGGPRAIYPPNKVVIFNSIPEKAAIILDAGKPVKAVRLRRDRIVVVLEGMIKVFSFVDQPELISTFETSTNPNGICDLCVDGNCSILAYPSRYPGHIMIADLGSKQRKPLEIKAHQSNIQCLTLNPRGRLLATASGRGTLIRIYETTKGTLINEFRRGSLPANIYCINFNHDSSMIVASSNHGTVHVFNLKRENTVAQGLSFNLLSSQKKSFAQFTIPLSPRNICAFGSETNSIIVVCADGNYYKYLFNKKGEFVCDMCTKFLEIE